MCICANLTKEVKKMDAVSGSNAKPPKRTKGINTVADAFVFMPPR